MNYLEKLRADIKRDFNEETFAKGDLESSISPTQTFRLDATNYWSKEPNWNLTKVEIYDQKTNEKLFDFFVNESQFFYSWLIKGNNEFFIWEKDIFGGQTVIDLANRKMASYSPNEDGFIWTDFHLSPNGKTLATIGCYWACSYVIKLFDFSEPMSLPLTEIKEIHLLGNDEIIIGWLDNETLQMKGVKKEQEHEYFEDGSFRMKTISETIVERQIKINNMTLA